MAYLEDDFIDDGIPDVEISDDELNAVFSVTEDGEDWDDEEGLDDDWNLDEDDDYIRPIDEILPIDDPYYGLNTL